MKSFKIYQKQINQGKTFFMLLLVNTTLTFEKAKTLHKHPKSLYPRKHLPGF